MSHFNEVRALIQEVGTEMVYIHDEDGKPILMVIPIGGWWASHLPKVDGSEGHFSHEHVYPWGGDE